MRPLGDPEVIEYAPVRQSSGAAGRFVKLCLILGGLLLAFAWHRYGQTDDYAVDGPLVFGFIGFIFSSLGILVSAFLWVRTGRIW